MKPRAKCKECESWKSAKELNRQGRCRTCVEANLEKQSGSDPFAFLPRVCNVCKKRIPQGEAVRPPLDDGERSELREFQAMGVGADYIASIRDDDDWWCRTCYHVYERELALELEAFGGFED